MKFLITLLTAVLLLTNVDASNEDSLAQCYAAFLPELKQGKMTKDEMKFLEKVTRGIQMYELILAEAKNKGDMEVSYVSINDTLVPAEILIKLGSGVIELRLKKIRE